MNDKMRAQAWYRAREDRIIAFAKIEHLLPFSLMDYIAAALAVNKARAKTIFAEMMEAKNNIAAAQPS